MKLTTLAAVIAALIGCKDKGRTATKAGDMIAKMTELRDKMCACKDGECAMRVSDEAAAWTQQYANTQGSKQLGPEDQQRVSALGIATGECLKRATLGKAASAPTPAGGGAGSDDAREAGSAASSGSGSADLGGLPDECREYKAVIDRLSACEALSKQARETLVKAYDDIAPTWANLPEASKANVKVTCKAGVDSVTAIAKKQCGW